uniref:Fibrous sheath-interacting protein 2 C-terminal domain-containing protein n=1 Tax=Varanus komodoensis TaxID=61221 RepID=A0A8D2IZL0_VARKO
MESLAERAAEIILTEILDYQLPPHICRRLPQSAYENVQAGPIIQRIEHRVCFPKVPEQRQSPPTYITILSQKYLERVINQLLAHFFPPSEDISQKQEKRDMSGPGFDELSSYMITEVMKSIAKHKIWVAKRDDQCQLHSEKEVQGMVDSVYKNVLTRSGSQTAIQEDIKHQNATLVEHITSFIIQEITKHHLQTFLSKDGTPSGSPDPEALSENIVRTVLDSISKPSVSQANVFPAKYLEEIVSRVLSKIFGISVDKKEVEDQCAEFDFIHMKLLSKVMAELAKDKDAKVQYLDRVQPNRVISQTVANSIYSNLLPEFGTTATVEKCIKAGCTVLSERIADFETPLQSHLRGLSSIFIEEVAAKLLSKVFHALPLEDMDAGTIASMKEVAKKIINSLQRHLSKNKFRVWQQADTEDLGSEDSQAVGEVVDSVYTDIVKHSSSGTSLYEDITNKNDDFVNQVACFVVSEISRRDFQSLSGSEDELCSPSAVIQLESERIVKKFLSDMDLGEAKDDLSEAHIPLVPVLFLEEILSRFLTTILLAQYDLGIHGKKSLSTTNVNEIVGLLKTSVEKEMSKNKIGLVASNDKPILDPEYEETVNQVVHSVISNVLEKSGSQKELYNDMTTRQVIFPEQVASIIINEISSCTVGKPLGENLENETFIGLEGVLAGGLIEVQEGARPKGRDRRHAQGHQHPKGPVPGARNLQEREVH